jgi:lipopolysaccharide heptosyltransferase II
MTILVRLPNWLGDLVMSTAFVRALTESFANATIEVVVKKGIDTVVDYLPGIHRKWIFDKEEYPGLLGAWRFGRKLAQAVKPDLFLCLPDSFSSAAMAMATGAPKRMGFRKEARGFLLTHRAVKDERLHRTDQYLELLTLAGKPIPRHAQVRLNAPTPPLRNRILINPNSEADSRRLPAQKAISILNALRRATQAELILMGSPKEVPHVTGIFDGLENPSGVVNMAGKTSLPQLIDLMGTCGVMLTTDSGPMHLANALGVHTVALEGASDERNTAPYNANKRTLIRSGLLPCEPCVKNVCKFGVPKCLMNMQETVIVQAVLAALSKTHSTSPE